MNVTLIELLTPMALNDEKNVERERERENFFGVSGREESKNKKRIE
jgi:hypothetical protein